MLLLVLLSHATVSTSSYVTYFQSIPTVHNVTGNNFLISGAVDLSQLSADQRSLLSLTSVRCVAAPFNLETAQLVLGLVNIDSSFWDYNFPVNVTESFDTNTSFPFTFKMTQTIPSTLYIVKCSIAISLKNSTVLLPPSLFTSPAMIYAADPLQGQTLECEQKLEILDEPAQWGLQTEYDYRSMDVYTGKQGGRNAGDFYGCKTVANSSFCSTFVPNMGWTGNCVPNVCDMNTFKPAFLYALATRTAELASRDLMLLDNATANFVLSQLPPNISSILYPYLGQAGVTVFASSYSEIQFLLTAQALDAGSMWTCGDYEKPVPTQIWYWATPLILIALLVAVSTTIDWYISNSPPRVTSQSMTDGLLDEPKSEPITNKNWKPITAVDHVVQAFSMPRNWSKLFAFRGGPLQFLDGVRFYSSCWVILGHSEIFLLTISGMGNLMSVLPPHGDGATWWYQIVPGGFFAVDIFFWIGGFLATFGMLKKARSIRIRSFTMSIPFLWFRRWLRLVPSILLVLGAYWILLPNVSNGPFWAFRGEKYSQSCNKYWWTEIMFLTAWKPEWQGCIGVTWYLTCDFLYFACTPFVIAIHLIDRRAGILVAIALFVASSAYYCILSQRYELQSSLFVVKDNNEGMTKSYYKPTTRAGAYIVGTLFGMLYDHIENFVRVSDKSTVQSKSNKTPLLSWTTSFNLQCVGVTIISLCVFGVYDLVRKLKCSNLYTIGCDPNPSWSQSTSTFYNVFSRPGFVLGMTFLSVAWIWGPSSPLTWFFDRPIMAGLGKLSFLAYLWHMFFVEWYYGSQVTPPFYTRLNLTITFFGFTAIAFLMALISHLFVEAPFANLEGWLMGNLLERRVKK